MQIIEIRQGKYDQENDRLYIKWQMPGQRASSNEFRGTKTQCREVIQFLVKNERWPSGDELPAADAP